MPRLPTMRVIGSHDISVRSVSFELGPDGVGRDWVVVIGSTSSRLVAGLQLGTTLTPLRFPVEGVLGESPQRLHGFAVHRAARGRDPPAGWFVHERHELVREARHRAADANATHVRAATDAVDPAALGHVAVDDRAPAAELDDA